MQPQLAGRRDAASMHAPLDRHTLVWLKPRERERMYAVARDEGRRDALRRWFASDWPLVVRRPDRPMPADAVALGLPLPPSEGKQRLGFEVENNAISRFLPPLRLQDAARVLPSPWRMPLDQLAQQAAQVATTLHVFGSVAWQALTGLAYLTAESDVDLWWQPVSVVQLERVIALITEWQARHGLRADGEAVFPSGAAVAWREWHDARTETRILAKRIDSVELVSRDALAATLQS